MNKKTSKIIMTLVCMTGCFMFRMPVYASDGQEYITISVDAVDENGNLKYALDTDDPSAFTDSNEFVIPTGTSHTIYVKDAAGNVSSQTYPAEADDDQYISTDITDDEDEQRININLELGGDAAEQEDYEITDITAEPGTASVSSKTKTDGSDSADKVFYNFTTKEGETLYLVIDQARGTDNVYLLDTVSLGDLKVMADGQTSSYGADEEGEDNLLSALTSSTNDEEDIISEQNTKKSGRSPLNSNVVIVLIFAVVGGGAYYYLKVYKNKKDEAMDAMDAMDMDEFEPEEEEEDLEFDYDDAEKERYLDELINEDDSLYDTDPEEYATSHIDEEDYDVGIELDDDEPDINEDDEEAEE